MTASLGTDISPGARGVEAGEPDMGALIAYEPPPLVPEKAQEKWADYLHRTGNTEDSPISNGLKWFMAGYPIREAAGKSDCKKSTLYDAAARYGLRVFHANLKDIIGKWHEITNAGQRELDLRLQDDPDSFTPKDLIILAGVGTDKVMAHAKGDSSGSGVFLEGLAAAAERIATSGATFKFEISPVERPEPEVIEVNSQ